ncbi:hypothetical protein DPMN_032773 [Dreissena polymorpha]|uniref:HAT C-terminal dimerisation domain-containing protein n=1 Tax=Dreissena polymorpha TaxID=45954 RepID=A0A9D4M5D0_DREPO|nr:hypothetical protein DPMN_032773 [Dreissena polymorpha]
MDADKRPKTLLDAPNAFGSAYPLIQLILTELLTMSATSAFCERSFSSIKRVKTCALPWEMITVQRLQCSTSIRKVVGIEKVINTFASTKSLNL